ncbi:four helix bundle protein [Bacteroidota bacterium]
MNDLNKRLFDFAVFVIKFLNKLPYTQEFKVIKYQLIKSGSSSGANYEEAQSGSSKADFIYKTEIVLREMKESNYWLRLLKATTNNTNINQTELDYLIQESLELKKILAKIIINTKKNL